MTEHILTCTAPTHKPRSKKPKPSELERIEMFWAAPDQALFTEEVIAPVVGKSIKTLQCDRWRQSGIPFRKAGRILYRKSDVIMWLESHPLVQSTSEYKQEEQPC